MKNLDEYGKKLSVSEYTVAGVRRDSAIQVYGILVVFGFENLRIQKSIDRSLVRRHRLTQCRSCYML